MGGRGRRGFCRGREEPIRLINIKAKSHILRDFIGLL